MEILYVVSGYIGKRVRCEYNYSGVNYSLVIVNAVLIAEKH